MANLDSMERIWFNRRKYEEAECKFAEHVASEHVSLVVEGVGMQLDPVPSGDASPPTSSSSSSLKQRAARGVDSIKKVANFIGESLKSTVRIPSSKPKSSPDLERRVKALENEVNTLKITIVEMNKRMAALESEKGVINLTDSQDGPSSVAKKTEDDDDDDFDLFGPDEDEGDDEGSKTEQPVQPAKPVKKKPIAKSSIVLEVKPWDDETDMKEVETNVRSICTDGLLWGASKLVPVGYGINKLQISCIVEDDKVGTEFLEEEICKFDDLVQSVDVAAFNKL